MTAEEKLTIIRRNIEESFCHYSALAFEGLGSTEVCLKRDIHKHLLDWLDKVNAEDEDFAPKGDGYQDEDVVAAARKEASGVNCRKFRSATDAYIRGFYDGQYWRLQNPKDE